MSSSDSRMFEELVARVDALERLTLADMTLLARVDEIERKVTALADLAEGKDVSDELYGAEADHTADRAERAQMRRPPDVAGMPGSARPRALPGGGT